MRQTLSLLVVTASLLFPGGLHAQDADLSALPPKLAEHVTTVRNTCRELLDQELRIPEAALSRVDLTGDGQPDWAFDDGALDCGGDNAIFCGSGGCTTQLLAGEEMLTLFGRGWEVVATEIGPVILSFTGGAECGGPEAMPCVRAWVWSGERFVTTETVG